MTEQIQESKKQAMRMANLKENLNDCEKVEQLTVHKSAYTQELSHFKAVLNDTSTIKIEEMVERANAEITRAIISGEEKLTVRIEAKGGEQ